MKSFPKRELFSLRKLNNLLRQFPLFERAVASVSVLLMYLRVIENGVGRRSTRWKMTQYLVIFFQQGGFCITPIRTNLGKDEAKEQQHLR